MSELYELPDGWEWKNIESIIKNKNDFTDGNWVLAKDYDLPKEVRLLQLADVGESYFIDKSDKWVSENKSIELKGKYINTGDILISRLGEILAKSCIIPKLNYKTMTSVDIAILRMNEEIFHNKYIMLYFNSNTAKDFVNKEATGATRKRISRKNLGKIPLPFPPLQEQKRIVSKLDTLFEKIDKSIALHQKNMDEANVFMGSVLNESFQELQTNENVSLKNITSKIGSGSTPRGGQKAYKTEGISLIRSMNVHDDGFREKGLAFIDDEQAKKLDNVTIQENDVLLNITGASVARCCIVDTNYLPARVNQHVSILRLKDVMLPKFLHYYLISPTIKTELLKSSSGGATREAITKTMLEEFQVPVVPLSQQEKIVTYLDEISQKIEKIKSVQKEKMKSLVALKASILDQAFRGEL